MVHDVGERKVDQGADTLLANADVVMSENSNCLTARWLAS
jgi:hypothetical protein